MTVERSHHAAGLVSSYGFSRPLRRLLRSYASRIVTVRAAEAAYQDVVVVESLRHGGKVKRASAKRIDAAFEALVDAVVDLQRSRAELFLRAEDEGILLECVGDLDMTFESADRECAGYLAARTFQQVRAEAAGASGRPG